LQHRFQIQQGLTTDCRHCRQLHSATNRRIEHPLRDLQESTFEALFYATAEQSTPIPGKGTVDRHHAVVPRMPRVTDFSRFSTMGVALSTCTTKRGRILDWPRTRRRAEFQSRRLGKGRKVISRPRIGGLHHRYAVRLNHPAVRQNCACLTVRRFTPRFRTLRILS